MVKSNQLKGEENAQILRDYIEKSKKFPLHNGRLNKTKLLADLGIPSARQRSDCAAILKDLDKRIATKKVLGETFENSDIDKPETVKRLRQYINVLQQKLALKEAELDAYRRNEAAELLLVKTGRILPFSSDVPQYLKELSSKDD